MTDTATRGRGSARRGLLLAALLAPLLGACDGGLRTERELLARQQVVDTPQLWRLQVIGDDGGVVASGYVCADTRLRETFTRTRAEINGEPCEDIGAPVLRGHEWALRCQADGRRFAVSALTTGDPATDFRLVFALTPLDHQTGTARQERRFQKVGACPAGWRIGDAARPGQRPS